MGQTFNKSMTDWVGRKHKYDWDCTGGPLTKLRLKRLGLRMALYAGPDQLFSLCERVLVRRL
jgi:hypothetical protein